MKKHEKLRKKLNEKGIDAVIILDELNQRYLSDFAFTDGLLLITNNYTELITDFRYYEMAEKFADNAFRVTMPENRDEYIADILKKDGCVRVGFEGASITYSTLCRYKEKFDYIEFIDVGNMVEELRQIKTPEEIKFIQKAQDITDKAFSHILNMITPNMTEIDVAAELEYIMRRSGAESVAFDTVAVSGDASALPHGTPRNVKLKKGFLTMDYGAKYNGYCSDMTRTVIIGKADADMKKLYNTVLESQLAAINYLREAADMGEADKIARDIIDSNPEYKGMFGHSLGHSVGLYIHESPGLSKRSFGKKMRVGEIFTVEPGIYLYGKYGCRIEDMVAVEESGVYNFTHSAKELIEIM